ncbi:hypothetical protein VOLCADRAFT_98904 [Volvox carteri f. nagariensis]|uniref:Extracellular solute-binding protein n=1 Tax=Volvox carteri f. nagariensis TaxID=3068 RepID=D8UGK2_VOLCA|nr:uncharacterized protein VOLCADRAFT_98904 [Volvox carteri f. nagariensis]EFJ41112.1 hypothetical protein VOLCADRAFT_98904 [Volvox carteri f. nagariensis]|eukprot:XP_002957784.1 hypothetical protein VOLCADRAFT_98904 [Volvox carteri f. nagariensis]
MHLSWASWQRIASGPVVVPDALPSPYESTTGTNITSGINMGPDSGMSARWIVQNRSQWDTSLLDLARGRVSHFDGLVLDPAIVPEMVASGALLSLEPFLATDRWQGQWPGILSVLRWQVAITRNTIIPLGAAAVVLHYRADVLARHDLPVPRTWEQLLMAVRAVHGRPEGPAAAADPGFYGFCKVSVEGERLGGGWRS